MHGGHALSGPQHPNFKTGKYSKVLPARLMERYEAAASDPELLSMRDEIAIVDARLVELIGRVETGEAGALWRQALSAYDAFIEAQRDRQAAITDNARAAAAQRSTDAITQLGNLLDRGVADHVTWGEIMLQLETRRRLVESERKRLVEMQQMITSEQAMTLISALTESVRTHVTDRSILQAIQSDFVRLARIGGGKELEQ